MSVDLKKYQEFVQAVTSAESQDLDSFVSKLSLLDANCEAHGVDGKLYHGSDIKVTLFR